jgi:hypothetical protein
MNILEKIKELKALRAELGEQDIEEKQAYTETIVSLVKQMANSPEPVAQSKPVEVPKTVTPEQHAKNSDFEFRETDVPDNTVSQIMSKTKYIPQ